MIGIAPGESGNRDWQLDLKLFVPASVLRVGENEILFQAGLEGDNYDNHYVEGIKLEVNGALVSEESEAVEIPIAAEIQHLGDQMVNEWEMPEPTSTSFTGVVELPHKPAMGALLMLKTFNVLCANPLRFNDNSIGNLPGTGQDMETWTNDVPIIFPRSC